MNTTTISNERFLELIEAERDLKALESGASIVEAGNFINERSRTRIRLNYEDHEYKRYAYITTNDPEVVAVLDENKRLNNEVDLLSRSCDDYLLRIMELKEFLDFTESEVEVLKNNPLRVFINKYFK